MNLPYKIWEKIKGDELKEFVKAQEDYCNLLGIPIFMPENGICYKCKKDITLMITMEEAQATVITSCPHCSHSFIE